MIVEKFTMQETVNALQKLISNRTQTHSGRRNKENTVTHLLMEKENKKYWWMLRTHHEVS